MTRSATLCLCLCVLCFVALPSSARQAELLGPDLEPQRVALKSFGPGGAVIVDAQGTERTVAADQLLRLTFSDKPARVADGLAVVRLRDGQTLVGAWQGAGRQDDSLGLYVGEQGAVVDISLDDVLSLSRVPVKQPTNADPDLDKLVLANGEELLGFVDAVADTGLSFEIDGSDQPIPVPFDRVHAVTIANRPRDVEPEPGLARVSFFNGMRLHIRDAAMLSDDQGKWSLKGSPVVEGLSAQGVSSLGPVMKIEPITGKGYRLGALTDAQMKLIDGGEVFGLPMRPAAEGDGTVSMHAPVTVGFDLPSGAARLVFDARLDLDDELPPARRELAGCELVVYQGDAVIGGCKLTPNSPPQRLNLPLDSGELRIQLKPGVNGPVLDRVRLTGAELLIRED